MPNILVPVGYRAKFVANLLNQYNLPGAYDSIVWSVDPLLGSFIEDSDNSSPDHKVFVATTDLGKVGQTTSFSVVVTTGLGQFTYTGTIELNFPEAPATYAIINSGVPFLV